jgi:hypothetical protein
MPDDDLDLLLAAGPRPKTPAGNECATGWALRELPDATADKFRQAMSYNVDPVELAAAFKARGLAVSHLSISRHTRGGCNRCADKAAA